MHARKNSLHKVVVVSTSPDSMNHNATIRDYLYRGFAEEIGHTRVWPVGLDAAFKSVLDNRPNLIVAVGSVAVDSAPLRSIADGARSVGARLAFWLHDDPYEMDYLDKVKDLAEHIFTNDRWASLHYRNLSVSHLPMAACRQTHGRNVRAMADRPVDLFFCGAAFKNRINLLSHAQPSLAARRVEVRGAGWPGALSFAENTRMTASEMADRSTEARLTLNIGRDLDIANQRYRLPASTPGPRTFEAALSGAPQLYFAAGLEILDYFEEGREILLFDDALEIEDAIARSYREPKIFEAMAERARERVLEAHTYRHRAQTILSVMAQH